MNADQLKADEQEITRLREEWNKQYHSSRKKIQFIGICCFAFALISFGSRILATIGHMLKWWDKMPDAIQVMLIMLMLPSAFCSILIFRVRDHLARSAKIFADIHDVRSVAPLLSAVHSLDSAALQQFTKMMTLLLPQITASDAELIDSSNKAVLYVSVRKNWEYLAGTDAEKNAYRLAALHAITQIGDEKAVKPLEKILDDGLERTEIKHAAQIALDAVKQRAEQTKESQTLLRASSDNAADATLLKPAMPQNAEQDDLLRPVIQ